MIEAFDDALVLTGPTASGKSAVGLLLAKRLGAEIIAMDSMTLYRGMDIGTAKPSQADRKLVRHHLIDVLDPWESASVAWWLERAAECVQDIESRGKRAIFVGGTPLYLKALMCGLFKGPPANRELRARLEKDSAAELHQRLSAIDPATAKRVHPNDQKRLVRALEVYEATGKPISEWQKEFTQPRPRRFPPVWLDLPRDVLYQRIDQRVLQMMEHGLLDEVRKLLSSALPLSKEARQALGYKELIEHLEGKRTLDEAVTEIQTRTRNFAKRQLTWLRNMEGCLRMEIAAADSAEAIAERLSVRLSA